MRENHTLEAATEELASAVGSTPSIAQGWRPYSDTNQPSSHEIHGSGRLSAASQRNNGWRSSARRAESQKESAKSAMKKKPMPTMTRNDQNNGPTDGAVSRAARAISSSVASTTLGV